MCGIVGFTGKKDPQVLGEMLEGVHHRGVDDVGLFKDGNVSLGMKRLAINDLRKGLYPLKSPSQQLLLVYNGEIYNCEQLKKKLGRGTKRLKTKIDGEIILSLYERYGKKCLDFLDGMFAFVLYDRRRQILLCARDRFGEKPFYYSCKQKTFIFGSEAKSLFPHPLVAKKISAQGLFHYLRFGFAPFDSSIFEGIKKLPPGHLIEWDVRTKKARLEKYWDLDFGKKIKKPNLETAAGDLEDLLIASAEKRLLSDVPIGVFLSGGVDSSLSTAILKKFISGVLPSFSVRIPGSEFDESQKASEMAEFLRTKHHLIDFSSDDAWQSLVKLARVADEPICDPGAFPTLKMSEKARELIKVVFTGEGADELFAGYEWYKRKLVLEKKWKAFPKIIARSDKTVLPYRLLQILSSLAVSYFPPQYFTLWRAREILRKNFSQKISFTDPLLRFKNKNFLSSLDLMQYTDIKSYLADHLLVKVDRATMASSLEARTIYLEKEVAEFSASLPEELKITKQFQDKYLLRKVAEKYLPSEFCWQEKHGFNLPLNQWLRGDLFPLAQESISLIDDLNLPLDSRIAQGLLDNHKKGENNGLSLWCLICLINWYKNV
jgi:asparagine synthase (glutamine-hydrolysing)